ncbi:MAG TPA: DUF6429 family protein [Nevskiaceae bacterium]|nr:DUF6429 family protein [Nevskiaceae bacterium]
MSDASLPAEAAALDEDKIDEAVLAVLYLSVHNGHWAWKAVDKNATMRLHARGLLKNPHTTSRALLFTDDGLAEARRACERLFGRD